MPLTFQLELTTQRRQHTKSVQAAALDTRIKQPAIKSLLGCKTLEKFTIKRLAEKTKPQAEKTGCQISQIFTQQEEDMG